MADDYYRVNLPESELPTQWYNVIPDLPAPPPPPLHPGTLEPAGPEDLAPLFPMALILQEVSSDSYIDIPGGVLDVLRLWRPSPLFRARRLEKALDTPAKIFYKYEGVSPAGSHKPNTAVPQAYYNNAEGVTKLTTETGAGQWGSALAFACSQYGMECEVWQVAASYRQKPYRKTMMELWGAKVHSSPSPVTEFGRELLAADPDHPGSLGIAISEAVSVAAADPAVRYSLGSVLNHVLMHQTVIGEEALRQLAMVGETPDLLVGCTGGGSNFGGLALPFLREKLAGNMAPTIRCVEPASCPTLTKGEYRYDFGDTACSTPLFKMHTLGHGFIPAAIHAGGLRYHGMSPLVSHIHDLGLTEAVAIPQSECFAAGLQFARTEGIVPAPEPTHALAATIREALACKESGESRTILTAMCGHGHLDLSAYESYISGAVSDFDLSDEAIAASLSSVPVLS
ncbi:MAG: TrpB-like pyridoxal phosphate-dependent enzyme [Acidimicrobiaceae bacterium]|nr:TrpB-like pyridoxal phosphate-dependent enzyme [Acidimicrobiaceae bacterium]MYD06146.1 TrpB-like pyridoxal phosphate-dependent enzyme [Acidimicrobiaceae bacterium]MYI57895.1 TrpB-like pyridoxal phosphate-dependent enzyme [Acidimicrobiaceae bacterium]